MPQPTRPAAKGGQLNWPVAPKKAELLSRAIDRYGLTSLIDVGGCWGVNGGYTFHALAKGKIERAVIVDGEITDLTREQAAGDPRVALVEGSIGDAGFIDALPASDAAIVYDVLLHQVSPDWDEFLARYARKVDRFVIYNQDWIGGDRSLRYVDQGLDWYLENVGEPDRKRVTDWFARHESLCPALNRPWKDVFYFWQWGIVDTDLIAVMRRLGFKLDFYENLGVWSTRYPKIQNAGYLFSRR